MAALIRGITFHPDRGEPLTGTALTGAGAHRGRDGSRGGLARALRRPARGRRAQGARCGQAETRLRPVSFAR